MLAVIEALTDEELMSIPVPDFALRKVTADLFFTGGYLIGVTAVQLQEKLLTEFTDE